MMIGKRTNSLYGRIFVLERLLIYWLIFRTLPTIRCICIEDYAQCTLTNISLAMPPPPAMHAMMICLQEQNWM